MKKIYGSRRFHQEIENNKNVVIQLITMNKTHLQQYAKGVQATGHLLIASLALLSSDGHKLTPIYEDLNTKEQSLGDPISITAPQWLRQLGTFAMNEFDKTIQYRFPLEPAAKILESSDREKAIQLLFNICITLPLVRIFELLKSYVEEKNQSSIFTSQPWYRVAYLLRNCFSHDFIIDIKGQNETHTEKLIKKHIPAEWGNIKITRSMLGKPLSHKHVKIGDQIKLIDTMCNFTKQL